MNATVKSFIFLLCSAWALLLFAFGFKYITRPAGLLCLILGALFAWLAKCSTRWTFLLCLTASCGTALCGCTENNDTQWGLNMAQSQFPGGDVKQIPDGSVEFIVRDTNGAIWFVNARTIFTNKSLLFSAPVPQ